MNKRKRETLLGLESQALQAKYLLAVGLETRRSLVDEKIVLRACVGDCDLPITGANRGEVIQKATEFLQSIYSDPGAHRGDFYTLH